MKTFHVQGKGSNGLRHSSFFSLFGWNLLAWAALIFLCLGSRMEAHPISLTSVFINVEEDKITAELNMLVEDLVLYYWMESDENFRFPAEDLRRQALVHQDFLKRHIHLRNRDGRRFEGHTVEVDMSELSEEGIPIDELMAYGIRYHFEFPFEERPDFLTVSQDFGGDDPAVPAEMATRFFHHGIQMEAAMLSHGAAHTVRLDWDAGWDRARDDLDAARERLRQRQEDALGITSYSAVYSYVYITDTEIRHELLIPLLILDTWLPLDRSDPGIMTVEEQRAAGEKILAFLTRHNRVVLDGSPVTPTMERLHFFGPEFQDFAQQPPARDVSMYNARTGIILSFPATATPSQMTFEWDYFNERLPFFRPSLYIFENEKIETTLDHRTPFFEWENDQERHSIQLLSLDLPEPPPTLHLPLLSLIGGGGSLILFVCALRSGRSGRRLTCATLAGGLMIFTVATLPYTRASVPHPFLSPSDMSDEKARHVFERLHGNIYRAFAYREEEQIYDALEKSVAGQLLEDLYLQIRGNLTVEEQGGAVSRISEIEILEGEKTLLAGRSTNHQAFAYNGTWTVTGSVEHWGHIHTRKNRYEAAFIIEGLPSGWKITRFEPLREERLERQIRLRR